MDKVVALADGGLHLSVLSLIGHRRRKGRRIKYLSRYDPILVLDRFVSDTRETSGDPMHHPETFIDDSRLKHVSCVVMPQMRIYASTYQVREFFQMREQTTRARLHGSSG